MLSEAMYASQDESGIYDFFFYSNWINFINTNADHEPYMKWITLREAVTIGQEFKYNDDQLFYHYTKDYSILKKHLTD